VERIAEERRSSWRDSLRREELYGDRSSGELSFRRTDLRAGYRSSDSGSLA